MTDTKTFDLLGLPPELRNTTYAYLFEGSVTSVLRRRRLDSPAIRCIYMCTRRGHDDVHDILLASKQLRSEALPIFYATTTFRAAGMATLQSWLHKTDVELRAKVKHLCCLSWSVNRYLPIKTAQVQAKSIRASLAEHCMSMGMNAGVVDVEIEIWVLNCKSDETVKSRCIWPKEVAGQESE